MSTNNRQSNLSDFGFHSRCILERQSKLTEFMMTKEEQEQESEQ
jgi:hypothetical protein